MAGLDLGIGTRTLACHVHQRFGSSLNADLHFHALVPMPADFVALQRALEARRW